MLFLESLSKPALSEVEGGEREFESHPMGEPNSRPCFDAARHERLFGVPTAVFRMMVSHTAAGSHRRGIHKGYHHQSPSLLPQSEQQERLAHRETR